VVIESSETPLAGARILITRAAEDAAPLRHRLEALGADVMELPAIEIAPTESAAELDGGLAGLDTFDWVAFTSRRAVRVVLDRLAALGISAGAMPRVAAVGPATEAELAQHGVRVACRPREATAAALGEALREAGIGGSLILLPVGDLARPELREILEAAGAQVREVVAYHTVPPLEERGESLEALRHGAIDVVAFASPSAVRNLDSMLGSDSPLLRNVRLVCIGPTTAAAVLEVGCEPDAVATEHTLDGLVAAIVDAVSGDTE
jgi:uroporphyrinogen-III synthase